MFSDNFENIHVYSNNNNKKYILLIFKDWVIFIVLCIFFFWVPYVEFKSRLENPHDVKKDCNIDIQEEMCEIFKISNKWAAKKHKSFYLLCPRWIINSHI